MVPFKNLMNDAYCRDISIKIRSNLEAKRKAGQYTGPFTPYGYLKDAEDKNRLVVDEYAAGVVKDIFQMKLQGMNQKGIADYLNEHGILSPLEYKHSIGIRIQDNFKVNDQAQWEAVSVRRILENEIYTGTLVQGKHATPNHKVKKVVPAGGKIYSYYACSGNSTNSGCTPHRIGYTIYQRISWKRPSWTCSGGIKNCA